MRARVTIRVSFDASSYKDAGIILDQLMEPANSQMLKAHKTHADVVSFETQPCKMLEYDRIERNGGEMEQSIPSAVEARY